MNPHDPTSPHHGLAVPVDQPRAEALRARLHEELIGRAAHTERSRTADRQELTVHTHPPEPRARHIITIAAIAVAAAGLAGVAVIASRDDTPRPPDDPPAVGTAPSTPAETAASSTTAPADTAPTTPTPTTTAPSTTAPASTLPPLPPLPDDQIAAAALPLRDAERLPEYGDGWGSAATIHRVEMRGDIAADVAACEPFLAAFESPDRPATVAFELAWHIDPPSTLSSTYAVVFPDDPAAAAMFDATRDPRFVRECSPAYDQALYEATGQTLSEPGFSYFPYFNDRPLPSITDGETYADVDQPDFGADDQWAIQLNYTTDTAQVTTVRVGRVVVVIQTTKSSNTLTVDDNGRAVARPSVVQTEEDYHAIIRGVVQRTREALAGTAPGQAG